MAKRKRLGIGKLLKAIHENCLDCCCRQPSEVRLCHITKCALHQYRMGRVEKSEAEVVQLGDTEDSKSSEETQ